MTNIVEIPALIDMHCHLREPGLEHKETIETGSYAALKGGFGTICAMANTKPVCDNVQIYEQILSAKAYVDVLPVIAVTKNLDTKELVDFKSFKNAIAFSNDGLPILDKHTFKKALETGALIMSHCENEAQEVEWQIEIFSSVPNARLHFCHISKKESVELIRKGKKEGLSAETAPHYFTFTKENQTKNGIFKMNPRLGTKQDYEAVIEGLLDGTLDVIATDHAPHCTEEKLLSFNEAPFGITGFETALGLGLKHFDINFLVEKMALNPEKILRIKNNKKIKVDLDKHWIFNADESASKCKVSPYNGMEFIGEVVEYAK